MTFEEIRDKAKSENWSRKRVRRELYAVNDPGLWARRDELMQTLGYATTEETAEQERAAMAEKQVAEAARQAELRASAATAAREAALSAQIAKEQADAKEAELAAYREEERAALVNVEPHWPTYREVIRLACECREFKDAARYRDVGDMMAYKHAAPALMHIAELCLLDDRSVAADILRKTGGAMSDKQAKLVALILAKLATRNGMTGTAPLRPDTAHKQEVLTAEVEEIAITLDRSLKQRVAARFTATKKTGKPYMAKIGPGFSREFAKGRKFTNTQKSFYFDDLQIGDVLEFRGYAWQGNAYEGGTNYAVIGQGVIFFVSRATAKIVIDGGNAFAVDRETPMLRLSPDAQAPSDLQTYSGREFAAWLVDESGEPINVRWPEGQEAE